MKVLIAAAAGTCRRLLLKSLCVIYGLEQELKLVTMSVVRLVPKNQIITFILYISGPNLKELSEGSGSVKQANTS